MAKYASQLNSRIDAYLACVGARQPLDLLFISHAHADHLNGLERLLDKTKGLAVKTIVMPLLNVEDRLIAYARAALEDALSADSMLYKAFVIDPASALGRFNPERIIFVESDSRDGGAPFNGGPDDPGTGPGDSAMQLYGNREIPWKLAGNGFFRSDAKMTADLKSGVAGIMPDSLGMVYASTGTTPAWLLAPYVDPSIKARAAQFMKALAAARGQTVAALKKWLRSTHNVEKLLTAYISDLKSAYAAIHADLNVTSMCLYSGPVPTFNQPASRYFGRFGQWTVSSRKSGVAWLGTGDAALADRKRLKAFFKHYGALLQEVVTMTLPHHGSEHNFDVELLDHIQPSFCIASADRFSNWLHPGTSVVQSVASTGRFLSVVTSDVESEVAETTIVA
ncbi:hypothetical protein [Cupriavidus necator]|uniref:hypothetical protein n=1 Tax=Cupriavidus necator TaxID=106590 RepID=UPI00115F93B6|nr:hypothetical protein [Cupriavidus necator]